MKEQNRDQLYTQHDLKLFCVEFCNWILNIQDSYLKSIKEPEVLFDIFIKIKKNE